MIILVTGGTMGIGKAIVDNFVNKGHKVITFARSTGIDISNEEKVKNFIEENKNIDILINNASIYNRCSVADMRYEDWKYMLSVNLDGVFLTCKYTLPIMQKQKFGRIINIISRVVNISPPYRSCYAASKAGVISLTKTLSKELNGNIKINGFCPGLVKTRMDLDKKAKNEPASVIPTIEMLINPDESCPNGKFFNNKKKEIIL